MPWMYAVQGHNRQPPQSRSNPKQWQNSPLGTGGLGAAVLGVLADHTSITWVYQVISFLPLLGIVAAFLPNRRHA